MAYDKFLIAPLTSGVQTNVKPWLIMNDAFESLFNVYTWRGRIKKRIGARVMNGGVSAVQQQFYTRLRVKIGTTDGAGDIAGTVPGAIFKIGQAFSIGDEMFTVIATGAPANMLTTGAATVATYNTATGAYVINGSDATTDVYFYPAEPVMGLRSYDVAAINNEQIFAFDTQFAYTFVDAVGWQRADTGSVATWTGSDSDFFWTANYRGAAANDFVMFVTNNVPADAMRYWNGANFNAFGSLATTKINPNVLNNDFIKTCLLIVPFKDRLLLLNTTENIGGVDQTYVNRVRYSQNGSPLAAEAWYETPQFGGYLEAPTKEAITAIDLLKDRLIVFFENSTWELVYNGNQTNPFQFQQLDNDLGVESTNSVISFNKFSLGFGSNGIHSCNGLNVDRIDTIIPSTIFDVRNNNQGAKRVAGIRDFWVEMVYWAFPSIQNSDGPADQNIYPNAMLVYDYVNNTWATNDDSITAFGNFYLQQAITWANSNSTWQETNDIWDDPSLQDSFRSIIAGNQQGFTFVMDAERSVNAMGLQITGIADNGDLTVTVTSIAHNLADDSYVYITGVIDDGGTIAAALNNTIFMIDKIDADTFLIQVPAVLTGNYLGGGVLTRVSQISLLTKQYNFYNKVGTDMSVMKAQFLVDRTAAGKMNVEWFTSSSDIDLFQEGQVSGTSQGTAVLETSPYALVPFEQTQDRFWHTIYMQTQGENVQVALFMSEDTTLDTDAAFSDFQLNAIMFYVTPVQTYGQQPEDL